MSCTQDWKLKSYSVAFGAHHTFLRQLWNHLELSIHLNEALFTPSQMISVSCHCLYSFTSFEWQNITQKVWYNSVKHLMWFNELTCRPLAALWYQNFLCITKIIGDHFKPLMSKFGQGLDGDMLSRRFVTRGRSYKDPSRVLKTIQPVTGSMLSETLSSWTLITILLGWWRPVLGVYVAKLTKNYNNLFTFTRRMQAFLIYHVVGCLHLLISSGHSWFEAPLPDEECVKGFHSHVFKNFFSLRAHTIPQPQWFTLTCTRAIYSN